MHKDIRAYNNSQADDDKVICDLLADEINRGLPEAESKVWHGHPVWFLNDNPTVGYSKQKPGLRLMFWSGADFNEPGLTPGTGKFMDASVFYEAVDEVNADDLRRWLEKSKTIQWDYKDLVMKKGRLDKIP